jgi:hypothetical protein
MAEFSDLVEKQKQGVSSNIETAFGNTSDPFAGIDVSKLGFDPAVMAQILSLNKVLQLQRPFHELATNALPDFSKLLSPDVSPGLRNRADQLGGLFDRITDFQVDPNDPAFKFREEQLNRQLNRRLAGAGKFDSRQGLDVIRDANLALTGSESERQFSRLGKTLGLGGAFLGDMSNLENIPFNRLLQAINLGRGATAGAAGQIANTGSNLSNIYQNYAQQQQTPDPTMNNLFQFGGLVAGLV